MCLADLAGDTGAGDFILDVVLQDVGDKMQSEGHEQALIGELKAALHGELLILYEKRGFIFASLTCWWQFSKKFATTIVRNSVFKKNFSTS